MFPVRCVVIQNQHPASYMPGFGADVDAVASQQAASLVYDIKKAAITAAGVSIGIQIGLLFVPVFGQALSAIMALVQYFTGKHYTQSTKDLIESTKADITAYTAKAEDRVNAAADAIYSQEYPAAAALAASGQSLGDIWSRINQNILAPIGQVLKKTPQLLTKAAITPVLETGRLIARTTGNQKIAAVTAKLATQAKVIEQHADPYDQLNVITGRDEYETARQSTSDMRTKIYAEIDKTCNDAIAKFNTPEFHTALRLSIAKAIRSDPTQLAQVQAALQAVDSQNNALVNQSQSANSAIASMEPTVAAVQNTGTTVAVGAGLAAAAAFFLFR